MTIDDFRKAALQARQFFEEFTKGEAIHDVRVEGIELSPEETWEVTLSYARPVSPDSPQAILARLNPLTSSVTPMERESKLVRIRASDGEVLGIRMLEPVP